MSASFADPGYLRPYLDAARLHGGGFQTLLWASPATQRVRFDAIVRAFDPVGLTLLDAGCGRGDLWAHLVSTGHPPAAYVGVEAVRELADVARRDVPDEIVFGDFVAEPALLDRGADVVVFCGSLNTADVATFWRCVRAGHDAARRACVFNFLCSPERAWGGHLHWQRPGDVMTLARAIAPAATLLDDYLSGDATVCLPK